MGEDTTSQRRWARALLLAFTLATGTYLLLASRQEVPGACAGLPESGMSGGGVVDLLTESGADTGVSADPVRLVLADLAAASDWHRDDLLTGRALLDDHRKDLCRLVGALGPDEFQVMARGQGWLIVEATSPNPLEHRRGDRRLQVRLVKSAELWLVESMRTLRARNIASHDDRG